MRNLTQAEYTAVLAMAEEVVPDEQREQLLLDIQNCTVESKNDDGSILLFHIDGYQRPAHRGQETFRGKDRFPVEGTVKDADGADMDVAMFVVHGRVYELELIRTAAGAVVAPDWTTFQVK